MNLRIAARVVSICCSSGCPPAGGIARRHDRELMHV
jgi:hypothetical protein